MEINYGFQYKAWPFKPRSHFILNGRARSSIFTSLQISSKTRYLKSQ